MVFEFTFTCVRGHVVFKSAFDGESPLPENDAFRIYLKKAAELGRGPDCPHCGAYELLYHSTETEFTTAREWAEAEKRLIEVRAAAAGVAASLLIRRVQQINASVEREAQSRNLQELLNKN